MAGDPKALARAGLTQIVDIVDVTTTAALTAVQETQNVVVAGAEGVVRVGDKTTDQLINEVRGLQSQMMFSLRRIIDSLSDVAAETLTGEHDTVQPDVAQPAPEERSPFGQ